MGPGARAIRSVFGISPRLGSRHIDRTSHRKRYRVGKGDTAVGHKSRARRSSLADVRFGSKADIRAVLIHVCFTPESGHELRPLGCPLCARSGHSALCDHVIYGVKFAGHLEEKWPASTANWTVVVSCEAEVNPPCRKSRHRKLYFRGSTRPPAVSMKRIIVPRPFPSRRSVMTNGR
jgi:hypothetical protein